MREPSRHPSVRIEHFLWVLPLLTLGGAVFGHTALGDDPLSPEVVG